MRILLILSVLSLTTFACASTKIYSTSSKKLISQEIFLNQLQGEGNVVLGEYHYQKPIQKAQGDIIKAVVNKNDLEGNFTVSWEFLDYPDQESISKNFEQWKLGQHDDDRFLQLLFPKSTRALQNRPYLNFFNAAKNLGGEIIATNAPRQWKKEITASGISNLDPEKMPANYNIGSNYYRERFKAAMGNHVPEDKFEFYLQAQSYTDAVMATSIVNTAQRRLNFHIVGSFHSDYNDGFVHSLKKLSPRPVQTIKIIDGSELTKKEEEELLKDHPKYGPLADYLYILNSELEE